MRLAGRGTLTQVQLVYQYFGIGWGLGGGWAVGLGRGWAMGLSGVGQWGCVAVGQWGWGFRNILSQNYKCKSLDF